MPMPVSTCLAWSIRGYATVTMVSTACVLACALLPARAEAQDLNRETDLGHETTFAAPATATLVPVALHDAFPQVPQDTPPASQDNPGKDVFEAVPPNNKKSSTYRVTPAISFIAPSAYGRGNGWGSVGVAVQNSTRQGPSTDGLAGLALGFGDRRKVGLDVGINFLSLLSDRGDRAGFGQRGSLNFKLDHALGHDVTVAAGAQNVFIWDGSDAPSKYYGVASKIYYLKRDVRQPWSRAYLSLGLQHLTAPGGFDTEQRVARAEANRTGGLAPFGSIAMRVAEPANLFAEWNGDSVDLGASLILFRKYPLVLTPALMDVAGYRPNGVRLALALSMPFSF